VPGVYLIDIHADYTGIGSSGAIEDRLVTEIVVGMDQKLLEASAKAAALPAGGLRIRFTPQDAAKNLLGPAQGGALSFAQGSKLFFPTVLDYLDGSYRADVVGIDTTMPFDLVAPGSRVLLWNPATDMNMPSGGCSASPPSSGGPLNVSLTLGLALVLWVLGRRLLRRSAASPL
jgi:hypothetical protein